MKRVRHALGAICFAISAVIVHNPIVTLGSPPDATPAPVWYDANGPRTLIVDDQTVVVALKPAPTRDIAQRPADLPPALTPENLHPAAARLEAQLSQRGIHVVRGIDAAALRSRPDVAYALPVVREADADVPIYPTNRIILATRGGIAAIAVQALAAAHGCDAQPCERGVGRYRLIVRDTVANDPIAVAAALHARQDLVQYAHPDFFLVKRTCDTPPINDPLYHSHQWHLDGDTTKGAAAGSDINAEAAWDDVNGATAEGVPQVRVSILDECVQRDHPDLLPNYWAGIDLDTDPPDDDPSPDAGQRHGTACAGVAVAAGNNIGVRGAAPRCGLIGVKFFGATISEMADGFYFSVDPDNDGNHSDGAAVLSNSWSLINATSQPPDLVNAINFAATQGRNGLGTLVLFAAANNDHTVNGVSSLAQLPSVMAVGGTNSNATHTEFSDVGPEVGIATPTNDGGDDGVRFSWLGITTTDNMGTSGYNGIPSDLDYTNAFGGTSSATPLAAGVLALIMSQDPGMSAAQARAILQHTAVRLDEPYGRFDGITGHSHRYGFGKADAANAVVAAAAGIRWPDRIRTLTANVSGANNALLWSAPPNDYAGSLLVRGNKPFAWMPTDLVDYNVSDEVAPGVTVVHKGVTTAYTDANLPPDGYFYAVYPYSAALRYGFGAKAHVIREPLSLFYDNSEGIDPGWTHGGLFDEWARGTPTSANSLFGQSVSGSGPLAGMNGTRALGGNRCWGTDLLSTYSPHTDSWLATPLLNLAGVTAPVYLEYYDWCLLETYYDTCRVEVVDAADQVVGVLDPDAGGDYDWTRRVFDLSPYTDQAVKIRFRIQSDGLFQRDGWFIDEVRVMVAGASTALPPVANNRSVNLTQNTTATATLLATDPNTGTTLQYVIVTLPAHGTLTDPNGAVPITAVPYTLNVAGSAVQYTPPLDYQGPDQFEYQAFDGVLFSNTARVSLSVGTPVAAYSFNLDTNPGWNTEGDWAWGQPLGQGGDPIAGFTGLRVYGYNLAGAYPNNLPPRYLTMQPLNCTGLSRVTLNFARWLGVEAGSFDKATIQASTDGMNWHTVWQHTGADLQETAWSQQSHELSAIADNQPFVMIRWGMGPTDGGDTFSGWNIDDVVISAIGTPPANQPPLARTVNVSTAADQNVNIALDASDPNADTLAYTIVSLPETGTLHDPNAGQITSAPYALAANGGVVVYEPDPDGPATDAFTYRVSDGELDSNVAPVNVQILHPAPFPFTEDFEAGPPLSIHWQLRTTSTGRTLVTNTNGPIGQYHVLMDSASTSFSLNELTLVVDLAGAQNVLLQYDYKEFGDEDHPMPASWSDTTNADGVAISADGITWHRAASLFGVQGSPSTYQTVLLDLDAIAAAAGISYNGTFRIRFQQYDNGSIPSDGVALDNIRLIQGTSDPLITTASLPDGPLGEPYGPIEMTSIGGDPPLTWSVLDIYQEAPQAGSDFALVGAPQGWNGPTANNAVFDYTLPFAFPFYSESHTQIKIAVDGWINFGAFVGSTWNNSDALLKANKRIAPLWDNMTTANGVGDIFIDDSVSGQITIRWATLSEPGVLTRNVSATLGEDGSIYFHYGPGNTGLTPTIGISAGDNVRFLLSAYNNATQLTDAASQFIRPLALPPGLSLTSGGVLSGTPIRAGTFLPIFRLDDSSGRFDERQIAIVITDLLLGDFDDDGDVDDDDAQQFRLCYTGPDAGPVDPTCQAGDFDGDVDIDCDDWQAFRQAYYASQDRWPLPEVAEFVDALLNHDVDAVIECMSDLNLDGIVDGDDVQFYVELRTAP